MAQDPVRVDSNHYNVEFENDRVRVLRVRYGAGEKSVMHGHPAGLAVALTDADVRFGFPGGTSEDRQLKAGQVLWLPSEEHLPENTGNKAFEVVLVELKG